MYQYEMFERLSAKGWDEYLGKGSFSAVYGNPDVPEWVIKVGENDGTRTYLEWVMLRTQQSKRMKGMPEVDWVVSVGPAKYMAAMRRYRKRTGTPYMDLKPEIVALYRAFQQETGISPNDVYFNNILEDEKGNQILTDPSSVGYRPLGACNYPYDFELAHSPVSA